MGGLQLTMLAKGDWVGKNLSQKFIALLNEIKQHPELRQTGHCEHRAWNVFLLLEKHDVFIYPNIFFVQFVIGYEIYELHGVKMIKVVVGRHTLGSAGKYSQSVRQYVNDGPWPYS